VLWVLGPPGGGSFKEKKKQGGELEKRGRKVKIWNKKR